MKPGAPSAHADVLVAAVKAAVGGVQVYRDGVPDKPLYPYVVVWSDASLSSDESLGDVNERSAFHPAITVAGQNASTVLAVRDRLDAIYDMDVHVTGRLVRLARLSATTIQRDDDLPTAVVYWCRDTLEMTSYAA